MFSRYFWTFLPSTVFFTVAFLPILLPSLQARRALKNSPKRRVELVDRCAFAAACQHPHDLCPLKTNNSEMTFWWDIPSVFSNKKLKIEGFPWHCNESFVTACVERVADINAKLPWLIVPYGVGSQEYTCKLETWKYIYSYKGMSVCWVICCSITPVIIQRENDDVIFSRKCIVFHHSWRKL